MRNSLKTLVILSLPFLFHKSSLQAQSKTAYVNFQVTEPSEVKLNSSIRKFYLADRSSSKCIHMPDEADTSSLSCLNALRETLMLTNAYQVKFAKWQYEFSDKDPDVVPPPMDWQTVAQLVNNDTTAELIVLEQKSFVWFDYQYNQKYGNYPGYSFINATGDTTRVEIKNTFVNYITTTYPYYRTMVYPFISTVGTGIKKGTKFHWRIYELKTKTIIDQYEERTDNFYWPPPDQLEGQKYQDAFYAEGVSFAHHLMPYRINVDRELYTGGNNEMKKAFDFAVDNSFESAAEIWKVQSKNGGTKIMANAYYNLGFYYETVSKLDSAIYAITQSKILGNKNAPYYLATLRRRKIEVAKLEEQLKMGQGTIPEMRFYVKKY